MFGQGTAEGLAFAHVAGSDFKRAFGHAEPAHAMREPCRAEANLRDLETIADFQQAVLVRYLEPVELELAVPAVLFRSEDRDAPHDPPARVVAMVKKCAQALARIV